VLTQKRILESIGYYLLIVVDTERILDILGIIYIFVLTQKIIIKL